MSLIWFGDDEPERPDPSGLGPSARPERPAWPVVLATIIATALAIAGLKAIDLAIDTAAADAQGAAGPRALDSSPPEEYLHPNNGGDR